MGRSQQRSWVDSRALVQRAGREYLIIKTQSGEDQPWEFPGGRVQPNEVPEAALRRLCHAQLGVELQISIGQPPFVHRFGTHSVTYRYHICGIPDGQAEAVGCAETRWVLREQLREYVFDAPTQQVVDWLLEKPAPD
jgi:ADP-ribose pyrophosphatase YjhB (NUDIX family)